MPIWGLHRVGGAGHCLWDGWILCLQQATAFGMQLTFVAQPSSTLLVGPQGLRTSDCSLAVGASLGGGGFAWKSEGGVWLQQGVFSGPPFYNVSIGAHLA